MVSCESRMTSVERILEYNNVPQETDQKVSGKLIYISQQIRVQRKYNILSFT